VPDAEIDLEKFELEQQTLYSLYMQEDNGDADEFDDNKATVAEHQYAVWAQ